MDIIIVKIVGKNIGDSFDVNVTFPTEYHQADLAGQPAVFKVKIHNIRERIMPELNEEFVQNSSEFDTVEEYKNSIRERLVKQAEEKAEIDVDNRMLDTIVDNTKIELPENMINAEADRMIRGMEQQLAYQGATLEMYAQYIGKTVDELKADQRMTAERQVKGRLVLEKLIRTENIDVRLVLGGLLIQTKENVLFEKWDVRTKNRPSQSQIDQMAFGMMIAMNSKSCSAVLVKNNSVVGLSQSCVSALKAIKNVYVDAKEMQDRLGKNNDSLAEVLISDSPIPFCDDVKNIIDGGVGAIIQPGGTVYDDEFVQYCNDRGVVMIFIGMSHILR